MSGGAREGGQGRAASATLGPVRRNFLPESRARRGREAESHVLRRVQSAAGCAPGPGAAGFLEGAGGVKPEPGASTAAGQLGDSLSSFPTP